jgi:hypothetical protein
MAGRPLRVELVGLVPTLFASCARGRGIDPVALCGPAAADDQAAEYDEAARADHEAAAGAVAELLRRFGGRVQPTVVGVTSPRGSWLALRHRLPPGLHAVVAGRRVVPLGGGASPLLGVVEAELEARR